MINMRNTKIWLFIIFSIYIITFSYIDPGLFSWFLSDEGLWANDARSMVLWNSLPEDGLAQSLYMAPLFYLCQYYFFSIFGVSFQNYHILLSLWGVFLVFVIMFLLGCDYIWGLFWLIWIVLLVRIGMIDFVSISFLVFSYYFLYKRKMYILSSLFASLSVLMKMTALPYAVLFLLFNIFLSFKERKYVDIIYIFITFTIPLSFHYYFIKKCDYYFIPLKTFLFYMAKLPLWMIVYKTIFGQFWSNPLVFLMLPLIILYVRRRIKEFNLYDYFLIVWIIVGISFMLYIGHLVPRRLVYILFPLFVLGEKGIKLIKGTNKELFYIVFAMPFILGSANVLRKNYWPLAFAFSKEVFYISFFVIFIIMMIICWKKNKYKYLFLFFSLFIIVWDLSHISFYRLKTIKDIEKMDVSGYVFTSTAYISMARTLCMNNDKLNFLMLFRGKNDRYTIDFDEVVLDKIKIPYKYVSVVSPVERLCVPGYKPIFNRSVFDFYKAPFFFILFEKDTVSHETQ